MSPLMTELFLKMKSDPRIFSKLPIFRCLQSQRDVHMMIKRLLVTGLSGDRVHGLQTILLGLLNSCVIRQHECKTPDSAYKLPTGFQKMNPQYPRSEVIMQKPIVVHCRCFARKACQKRDTSCIINRYTKCLYSNRGRN